ASAGVSVDHLIVVGTALPSPSSSVANSWSWNPTGSGGSPGARPVNRIVFAGGGGFTLHEPKLAVAGPYQPPASFWSESPSGSPFSATPMSVATRPSAGPPTAVIEPSYDRNSTTAPDASTSAMASGGPFWMPFDGYAMNTTPLSPQVAGIGVGSGSVSYGAPLEPL